MGLLETMDSGRWLARLSFPLMIAASLLVGWFVPAFYDWTGADQSRPSPLVGRTALALTVGAVLLCVALPWLPLADESGRRRFDRAARIRFKLRSMLAATAVVAVLIAALIKSPVVVSGILCAIAFGLVIRFWILHRHYRWQSGALVACMCLPFTWLLADSELDDLLPTILWMAAGLPAFFPACFIGYLVGQNSHDVMWLSILLTGAEAVIGIWVIRLGPRRTIAYLTFVLLMSTFGSFGLNALVRI